MKINWAEKLRQNVHQLAESLGNLFVETFHYLALFAIGAVTAWAAVMEFLGMLEVGRIKIDEHPVAVHLPGTGGDGRDLFQDQPHAGALPDLRGDHCTDAAADFQRLAPQPTGPGDHLPVRRILLLAFAILVVRLRVVAVSIGEDENPHRKTGAGSSEHPEVEKGEL